MNADKNIDLGIESVSALLEYEELLVVKEEVKLFKKEIGAYQWNERSTKPLDADNHTLDALRYAIHTHKQYGARAKRWG